MDLPLTFYQQGLKKREGCLNKDPLSGCLIFLSLVYQREDVRETGSFDLTLEDKLPWTQITLPHIVIYIYYILYIIL